MSRASLIVIVNKIKPDNIKKRIEELLLRLEAQSGIGSLLNRINICELMLQDSPYISDSSLRKQFVREVKEHIAALKQQLDNPITRTQTFIKVLNNINNNVYFGDADVFPGEESLYWIFLDRESDNQQTKKKKKSIKKDAKYHVNRLKQSLKKMDLEDIILVLDFVIDDFRDHERTTEREDFKRACRMIINQARDLRWRVIEYAEEQKEASKAAEDNLKLPDDVIGIIKTMNSLRF